MADAVALCGAGVVVSNPIVVTAGTLCVAMSGISCDLFTGVGKMIGCGRGIGANAVAFAFALAFAFASN